MDEIEEIKSRIDIVELIGGYLRLKRAGVNYKAACPFHNEKTPSFMVSPERQTFKCFGCGIGGDAFTFIENIEGVDFYNSLKLLADRAGVKLKSESVIRGQAEYKRDRKTRIYEINNWAKKVYHKLLLDHPKANEARKYLTKRGIKKNTLVDFEIGYAPNSWDLIIKFLEKKGYKTEEIAASGLVVRGERGDYYDRFRGRIIFPINNIMGATIAFTSRILKDAPDAPKYINSSESPIYIKGKTLYGLDKAKLKIKENDLAVFVEGNMDVISCHQAGFKNVVATSGTAITSDQIIILSRYASTIAFAFDSDSAGEAAMKKAVALALKNDINSKIITLPPPFKDADEAISSDSKVWQKAVLSAKNSLEAWIDLLIRKNPDLSLSAKKKITKEILPVIKTIYSPIEKEYYIKYLANKMAVSESSLISAIETTKANQEISSKEKNVVVQKSGLNSKNPIFRIAAIFWERPELAKNFMEKINQQEIFKNEFPRFYKQLLAGKDFEKIGQEEQTKLDQLNLSVMDGVNKDREDLNREAMYQFSRLNEEQNEGLRQEYAQKIYEAEKAGDKKKLKELLARFSNLIK